MASRREPKSQNAFIEAAKKHECDLGEVEFESIVKKVARPPELKPDQEENDIPPRKN